MGLALREVNIQRNSMKLSVVIPAFNEEGNIGRLVEETYRQVPENLLGEVVVVDDFSADKTSAEISELKKSHPTLRCLRHHSNAGQSASLRTGIAAARYDVIATLDGDGQNDPADIAKLARKIAEPGQPGPSLVGGIRQKRKASGSKRWASKIANWIRDGLLKDDCPDTGCGTKMFHRDAFMLLPYFSSMHRYLPALFQTYGFETVYVPVNDRPRIAGVSKYNNFNRALVGIYDLFGVRWLRKRTVVPGVEEIE